MFLFYKRNQNINTNFISITQPDTRMKFKLKQPTKYMHAGLQIQSNDQYEKDQSNGQKPQDKDQPSTTYKKKKIIRKKNQPSATRLHKINQTLENLYNNSFKLFEDLNIDIDKIQALTEVKARQKCHCKKNTKFYCLKCMHKVCKEPFPSVQLPFEVSIFHHESQKITRSSVAPLQFLTNQVKIYSFSSMDQCKNQKLWATLPKPGKGVFILFPHKQSKMVNEVVKQTKGNQEGVIKNLIILDCTWFQTDQIIQILKSKGYNQYVRIEGYKSIYWRYNHHNDEALSSAEALTFFMRQYQKASRASSLQQEENQENSSKGEEKRENQIKKYDNLLFLYCLNLKIILKEEEKRQQQNDGPELNNNTKQ